jgi:D-alanyl-D-alanine dipeptidase
LDPDEFVLEPIYFKWGHVDTEKMTLRSGTIEKLREAVRILRKIPECEGWNLKIWDGYRTLNTQKILYDGYYDELKKVHPDWTDEKLKESVEIFVCRPSYDPKNPSFHNTGGTVDLTLVDADGDEIQMGTPFDEFTERAFADHFEDKNDEESQIFHKNRTILKNIMEEAGFVGYDEEWWHYCYGTPQWAKERGTDFAIYGSAEI